MKIKRVNGYWVTESKDKCQYVFRHDYLWEAIRRWLEFLPYELSYKEEDYI